MINKSDILLLLTELSDDGDKDADMYIANLYSNNGDMLNVLKYINDKRQLSLGKFYEKLRKSYNEKKSSLYINIVKEIDNTEEVLTTLAAYVLQVILFGKGIEDENEREVFLRSSRVREVSKTLTGYFDNYNLEDCCKLLSLIKADIKLFEYIKND